MLLNSSLVSSHFTTIPFFYSFSVQLSCSSSIYLSMAQRAAQIAGHLNYPQGLLAGQVAIITGSGQGIGAEAARLFANEGAKVVVSDIDAGTAHHNQCENID
jgi:glutamate dehydrogenase/leucine dehydrogenase